MTARSLENAALAYLERFASSSANLRRILLRKVARSAETESAEAAEGVLLIDALIDRYLASGLLDDRLYATQRTASLRRRGSSRYAIRMRLAQKGVAPEIIETALAEEEGSGDLAAACALVRRRRLGPCRTAASSDADQRRDLAALARAGFSLDIARRVLAAPDRAALDRIERGEDLDD